MSIDQVWSDIVSAQPTPPTAVVLLTALAAAVLVTWQPAWRWVRGVVTIAHEGGHVLGAVLTGRRLHGVRLHSDTSGLTVSSGRASGPGMVVTLLGGYVAPSLVALLGIVVLAANHITFLLWLAIGLLVIMLLLVRNVYGVVSVVATTAVVVVLSVWASPAVQAGFAYLAVWTLLLAAPRPVYELHRQRRRGHRHHRGPDSDVDQLARLTRVSPIMWTAVFGVVTLGVAVLGLYLLLPLDAIRPDL